MRYTSGMADTDKQDSRSTEDTPAPDKRPDVVGPDEQGTPGKPDQREDSKPYSLKVTVGTVYVTPEGEMGVAGYDNGPERPLEHADGAAMNQLSGAIRKENANR